MQYVTICMLMTNAVYHMMLHVLMTVSIVISKIDKELDHSKSPIVALGKMPGSEGNHGRTAEHRQ